MRSNLGGQSISPTGTDTKENTESEPQIRHLTEQELLNSWIGVNQMKKKRRQIRDHCGHIIIVLYGVQEELAVGVPRDMNAHLLARRCSVCMQQIVVV